MSNNKAYYILIAIALGLFFPIGHFLTFLIRYNLMVMLFFSFLEVQFRWNVLRWQHLHILIANIFLPLCFYQLILPFNSTLAFAVFVIGIAPTAAVAPVITGFLKGNVEFVTTSVLISTPMVGLILPFLLPYMLNIVTPISPVEILLPVSIIIFGPLLFSQMLKWQSPSWVPTILRWKGIAFYLFLVNIFIASATATYFVRNDQKTAWYIFVLIGITIGLLCVVQFVIGEKIGRKKLPIACSLSLGRKNTMFAIWIALTFLNPVIALGPMFYIFFQNAFNGWQIWKLDRKQTIPIK